MVFSIRARLAGAFFGLAMLSGAQGTVSIVNLLSVKADLANFRESLIPGIVATNKLLDATSEVRIKQYRVFGLADSAEELAINTKQYLNALITMREAIKSYEPLIDSEVERQNYLLFFADWRRYEEVSDRGFKMLTDAGKPREALTFIASQRPLFDRMRGELNGLVEINNDQALLMTQRSTAAAVTTVEIAWSCMITAVCAAIALMLLSYKDVSLPITRLTVLMKGLASGDMLRDVPYLGRRDEIGAMAKAVEVFKASMIQNRALAIESANAHGKLSAERRNVMVELADRFEGVISGVVAGAAIRASEMRVTAAELADAATETAGRSATVALAALDTENNAASTASAAYGLGQSVDIVQEQVDGSAGLASMSVMESRQAEALITDLLSGASKIGDIVSLISTIASQTNLLALNAAIEAARAGDGGRGFAVVALEVKELAKQTSEATSRIADQIGHIQTTTGEAVAAIHSIGHRITQMSEAAAAIVAAVKDQKTATQGIMQSIEAAASGTQQVTGNISYVADKANATGAAAKRVLETASELAGQSEFLRMEVERFLKEVRAA